MNVANWKPYSSFFSCIKFCICLGHWKHGLRPTWIWVPPPSLQVGDLELSSIFLFDPSEFSYLCLLKMTSGYSEGKLKGYVKANSEWWVTTMVQPAAKKETNTILDASLSLPSCQSFPFHSHSHCFLSGHQANISHLTLPTLSLHFLCCHRIVLPQPQSDPVIACFDSSSVPVCTQDKVKATHYLTQIHLPFQSHLSLYPFLYPFPSLSQLSLLQPYFTICSR